MTLVLANRKQYCYAVYLRHPWGTDRLVVGLARRNVREAGDVGYHRAVSTRRTGDIAIMDVVPMKWVDGQLVETRKMRTRKGALKNVRRPKSRKSVSQSKRAVW